LKRIDPEDLPLDELVGMNFYEARHFIDLVRATHGNAVPSNWLQGWKDRERSLLHDYLQNASVYELDLPRKARSHEQFGQQVLMSLEPLLEVD
jgi:hypothetical protein